MRTLGIILLGMLGVGGLLATACGGFFGFAGLIDVLSGKRVGENFSDAFMIIGLPAFAIGLAITIACFRAINRMSKEDAAERAARKNQAPKAPGEQ